MRLPDPRPVPTAWRDLLTASSRTVSARATVLDRDEAPLGASLPIVSGSVSVDATADVTRSVDLVALDVEDQVGFEASSPWQGAAFADRFVQVDYGVLDGSGVWLWTPVFADPSSATSGTGRRSGWRRRGRSRSCSLRACRSSRRLRHGPAVDPRRRRRRPDREATWRDGRDARPPVDDAPEDAAEGHARADVGAVAALERIAGDAALDLCYDGSGRLTMREPQDDPVVTFDADLLTSWPNLAYDLGSDFRNIVLVSGKAHGKEDKRPLGWATPKANDPLAAGSLARNGKPRYIAEYIETDLSDPQKVQRIADQELSRRMRQAVAVDFDCLAVPGLEEGDPAAVVPPGDREYRFTIAEFGLDLGASDMSIGTSRRVRVPKVATR